jgi:branched-chain amino acid aminotransferase, group II
MKITLAKELKQKPDFKKLGFGKYFSDHMLYMEYADGKWGEVEIKPFEALQIDPASVVLHYGQELFEGMKAYKNADGKITMFRSRDNLKRMNDGAERLCMAKIPEEEVLEGLFKLVEIEKDWIPTDEGTSLYIRPTLIANENFLGVHPSKKYIFFVILSPVGSYYANGLQPTKIYVESVFNRAALGGTGAIKCGGNYASSLMAAEVAKKNGYDQVLWMDAAERKYVGEVGAMNMFFVIDGNVVTPKLDGTILPGITRDSAIKLLKKYGYTVEERMVSIEEIEKAYDEGKLDEAFGTGTAAVISPVGVIGYKDKVMTVNNGEMGKLTAWLYDKLTGIQYGRYADEFNWILKIN